MRLPPGLAAVPLALLSACFPGQSATQLSGGGAGGGSGACATCRRGNGASGGASSGGGGGATSGGGTGGGTTGAATAGGGGSTGGSGAADAGCLLTNEVGDGGSLGLFACIPATPPLPPEDGGCAGSPLVVQAVDLSQCQPVCGAQLGLLDQNAVPVPQGQTAAGWPWGTATLCVPPGVSYTPSASAAGYPTFYYGEIGGQFDGPYLALGMVQQATLSTFLGYLNPDPTKGILVAFLYRNGQCDVPAKAGWTLALEDPDGGGPWADGGYRVLYLGANGLPSSADQTSTYGAALFWNIDLGPGSFAQLAYANPDAGACVPTNPSLGFTGRIFLQGGAVSQQALFLP